MMTMFQVDAFADRLFTGNPAAVIIVERFPEAGLMRAIAMENNLSETAFACRERNGWRLRWFTPVSEVDFCGHATLATAHVLVEELGIAGEIEFLTRVGSITVSQSGDLYWLDLPAFPPAEIGTDEARVRALLDQPPIGMFRSFENLFVELRDQSAVETYAPDLGAVAAFHPSGLVVTARAAGECYDFVSRYFAPTYGIPEDPVTGSIHATLMPYWAAKLHQNSLTARQLSARGGTLQCRMAGDRVLVGGRAITFMKAQLRLGDPERV